MAKGALRPEDAAVSWNDFVLIVLTQRAQALRLRATLDRNMKSFQVQR